MNEEEELKKRLKEHAEGKSFKLNPDEELVNALIEGMIKNKEEYGEYYCPCRLITGDEMVDKKNICPCTTHEKEVEETGHCHCHLFVKR